jgi:hypothetical protein
LAGGNSSAQKAYVRILGMDVLVVAKIGFGVENDGQ